MQDVRSGTRECLKAEIVSATASPDRYGRTIGYPVGTKSRAKMAQFLRLDQVIFWCTVPAAEIAARDRCSLIACQNLRSQAPGLCACGVSPAWRVALFITDRVVVTKTRETKCGN